ncbi:molybdenum cofactor guanylyltransferase [Psychromonas sp. B3M02]|uniref:molybdenum cofactor guanylyltransferase n=1 Tax=Psychromonas sp. B3M02 TaxID=2267226 RepID=UPI000DE8D844|nr:molybdenum cofactor guanylyltransferase [Psychromonas sp. B3M02]RBW45070.1 molybdenum cofactor guanylyltransferase [Psychromonas sp. B3M02]
MSEKLKIAGIVLAGGESSRMGQDKAMLSLDQHTLLVHAFTLLKQAGIEQCFVSGDYPNFPCIVDQYAGLGPLAGIAACVEQLSADYDALFIIPVDMPLLAEQDCTELIDRYLDRLSHQPQAAGLYYKEAIFPLILTLNRALKTYLTNIMQTPHKKYRSLYRLFETLGIEGVSANETDKVRFENTNTPEQWQDCLTTYSRLSQAKPTK